MASYIDPRCAVPTFLLNNESDADYCGRIYGYITCFIMTIFVLVIVTYLYFQYPYSWNMFLTYSLICIITLFLIWLIIPAIAAWMNVISWKGYNAQKDYYMQTGFDKKEALNQLQSLEQTKMQANAITNAGNTIGYSITRSLADFALKKLDYNKN